MTMSKRERDDRRNEGKTRRRLEAGQRAAAEAAEAAERETIVGDVVDALIDKVIEQFMLLSTKMSSAEYYTQPPVGFRVGGVGKGL